MKARSRIILSLLLISQLCGCAALKLVSHADDVARVGKAGGAVAEAGHAAARGDDVVHAAGRAGSKAAQTGEVAAKTAAEAVHGGEATGKVAEVAGHTGDAAEILTLAYETFEDSAEEDDGWEADDQLELEKATAELKKEALTLKALSPEGKKEMAVAVEQLEKQVQKSAQSRKVEDMKEAGRLGAKLVSKVSAIRSNATMEEP